MPRITDDQARSIAFTLQDEDYISPHSRSLLVGYIAAPKTSPRLRKHTLCALLFSEHPPTPHQLKHLGNALADSDDRDSFRVLLGSDLVSEDQALALLERTPSAFEDFSAFPLKRTLQLHRRFLGNPDVMHVLLAASDSLTDAEWDTFLCLVTESPMCSWTVFPEVVTHFADMARLTHA